MAAKSAAEPIVSNLDFMMLPLSVVATDTSRLADEICTSRLASRTASRTSGSNMIAADERVEIAGFSSAAMRVWLQTEAV
jgi:hypothetical protein